MRGAIRQTAAPAGDTLTAAEAAGHLQALLLGMQRMRSAIAEELHTETNPGMAKVAAELLPWLLGAEGNAMLTKIGELLDVYATTGEISGSAFFNLVVLVNRVQPELRLAIELAEYDDFPQAVSPAMVFETLR